jgi:predicted TIM-barrel fold metal-dependent hydrolase
VGRTPRQGADEPIVIVSADTHIGPRLVDDLRPYCPARLLDAFDGYAARDDRSKGRYAEATDEVPDPTSRLRNQFTTGHFDPAARGRDLDFDGVAAEVIFHGSQNDQPIPFQSSMLGAPEDPELAAEGIRIYNRWLADYCAAEPARHVGLAHLPFWDVDAAVAELGDAAERGLKGVNFTALRPGMRPFNHPDWEPLWATAADFAMPLTTHAGAGDPDVFTGAEGIALLSLESGGWFSRRAIHQMIFAGVLERHPDLQLVMTEQPGQWWGYTLNEMDSVHVATAPPRSPLAMQVPRAPSEYCARQVSIGASFLSRAEAERAIADGYADRVLWGSDYPHMEGTYQYPGVPDFAGQASIGRQSLRFTFAGLPEPAVRDMLGLNAARVYGLDVEALERVADRIDAPTFAEVSEPLDAIPAGASPFAFRTIGPWA